MEAEFLCFLKNQKQQQHPPPTTNKQTNKPPTNKQNKTKQNQRDFHKAIKHILETEILPLYKHDKQSCRYVISTSQTLRSDGDTTDNVCVSSMA